eukprot:6464463-Amphidinium_carterae.1
MSICRVPADIVVNFFLPSCQDGDFTSLQMPREEVHFQSCTRRARTYMQQTPIVFKIYSVRCSCLEEVRKKPSANAARDFDVPAQ